MTITYTIPGATLLDQLNEPTMDGMPDENANDNCVAASIAEALHILTGQTFDGDELKDAVYGAGYVGFQSAARYVQYCQDHGVTLTAHNDTQAGLVATIHAEVSAGHPVVLTMPSQWGTPYPDPVHPSGSTHVGVAVGFGPGEIRVMNPWHAFWQDQPDSWWEPRLCEGQVWIMQKASSSMSGVPSGWTDDGTTLKAPNGVAIVHGFRDFVLANAWDASDVPLAAESDVPQVEIGDAAIGGGAVQWFERSGQLSWSATFNGGQPFRTWNGKEEMALRSALAAANAATSAAQANVAAAQGQRDALSAQLATAQGQLTQDQQQIAALQAQLATVQNQPAPAPLQQPPTPQQQAATLAVKAIQAALAALGGAS